jgi:hypothetical protein
MMPRDGYEIIIVETCRGPARGHHGEIRVQNVPDEIFPEVMLVRFPKKVREAHPIGTRFRVYARLVPNESGETPFLHTNHAWEFEVLPNH